MIAIVDELRRKYDLNALLKMAEVSRSTFYHVLKNFGRVNHDEEHLKDLIRKLYRDNSKKKEKPGYRKIYYMLRAMDEYSGINHKRVARLMREMGLGGSVAKRSKKYSSYKGDTGRGAPNLVKRNFNPPRPNMVWGTDVSEFRLSACNDVKVYLSPIKDFCDGSIVSYTCSTSPSMPLVMDMLNNALKSNPDVKGLIIHSDHGFQYQSNQWVERLEEEGIIQSMSRKGNCMDNGKTESFFGTLKNAIWYGLEKTYKSVEALVEAIDDYIQWYNEKRIQCKLNGLSPLQFRKRVLERELGVQL